MLRCLSGNLKNRVERICHRYSGKVGFRDTDASGWAHFTTILIMVERAEHEFLKQIGVLVFDPDEGGWPRVGVGCRYSKPLKFGDDFEVLLGIQKIGTGSLVWDFQVLTEEGGIAAEGDMATARVDGNGMPKALGAEEREILEGSR